MDRRRVGPRPRYGRLAAATTSFGVTAVAVLGGAGLLPSAAHEEPRPVTASAVAATAGRVSELPPGAVSRLATFPTSPRRSEARAATPEEAGATGVEGVAELPEDSGQGRRVVYSEGAQRVWLVRGDDEVARTYLVSGSRYDNLDPGTYTVYSRSEQAWGIDDSGTMRYFVRFTQGDNAAIGFHDIPVDDGRRVQTVDQLGTPLSHGCIRQRRADALALWRFASLGTTVVVTA